MQRNAYSVSFIFYVTRESDSQLSVNRRTQDHTSFINRRPRILDCAILFTCGQQTMLVLGNSYVTFLRLCGQRCNQSLYFMHSTNFESPGDLAEFLTQRVQCNDGIIIADRPGILIAPEHFLKASTGASIRLAVPTSQLNFNICDYIRYSCTDPLCVTCTRIIWQMLHNYRATSEHLTKGLTSLSLVTCTTT